MQRPTGIRRWAVVVLLATVIALVLRMAVIQVFTISSSSMEPTLAVGDHVLVDKISPRWSPIARGDVVVFDGTGSFVSAPTSPAPWQSFISEVRHTLGLARDPSAVFVKRVIGVGGDRVRCCDETGRLEVNGLAATEDYLMDSTQASATPFDVTVPDGSLWLLGDHRSASSDARDRLGRPGGGMVAASNVLGRARWTVWPWQGVSPVPAIDAWAQPTEGQQR